MRHLHIAFVGVVFLLVLAILLVPRVGEGGSQTGQATLEREYDAPTQGVVCCTWDDDGIERSCAAAPGRTCDVCVNICG